jgi:phage major head subunit gpT-like protein
MPSNITPRVAAQLNAQLFACFTEGVNDGILQVFTNTADGAALPNLLECGRFTSGNTVEAIYTYAPSDYTLFDDTEGDETPVEGVKMYESRIKSGRYKKREILVDLADFSDDLVGLYKTQFHTLGTTSVVAPYRRVAATMLLNPVTTIDDATFYSSARPQRPKESGGTPWSNDLVQPEGLTIDNAMIAWAAMCAFPGEDGLPVGSRPTHLAVEPADFGMAMDICYLDRPSGLQGGGNKLKGMMTPVIVPEWAGQGIFQMYDCRNSMEMPWIFHEREPLKMRGIYTNPEESWVRDNGKLKWNLQGRYNVGVGHPRRALRSRKA